MVAKAKMYFMHQIRGAKFCSNGLVKIFYLELLNKPNE